MIGERSPALQKAQEARNDKYIKNGKLTVRNADARNPQDFTKQPINGLIVSNELPDAFPVHKVWQMIDGSTKICISIPVIKKDWAKQHLSEAEYKAIEAQNSEFSKAIEKQLQNPAQKTIYDAQNNDIDISQVLIITKETWLLFKRGGKISKYDTDTKYLELYFDSLYFPETHDFLARHSKYIKSIAPSTQNLKHPIWYMNYRCEGFIKSSSSILNKGYMLTIDYGQKSDLIRAQLLLPRNAILLYPDSLWTPIFNDSQKHVYIQAGLFDITTLVNFTDICMVGLEHALNTIFYGPQIDLNQTAIAINQQKMLVPFDLHNRNFSPSIDISKVDSFNKSLIKNAFRMIIQQKNNTKSFYRLAHPSEKLFPEIELAVPYLNAFTLNAPQGDDNNTPVTEASENGKRKSAVSQSERPLKKLKTEADVKKEAEKSKK